MNAVSRRQFLKAAAWAAAGALVPGCAPSSSGPTPPEITYGFDVCESCGMLISEVRFACALVLEDGRALKFDDLGEMVLYHMDRPNLKVAAWFVHDYSSEAWTRGETAFYAAGDSIAAPMAGGLAAFSSRPAAETFAQGECPAGGCQVLGFDEMRAYVHANLHG